MCEACGRVDDAESRFGVGLELSDQTPAVFEFVIVCFARNPEVLMTSQGLGVL